MLKLAVPGVHRGVAGRYLESAYRMYGQVVDPVRKWLDATVAALAIVVGWLPGGMVRAAGRVRRVWAR